MHKTDRWFAPFTAVLAAGLVSACADTPTTAPQPAAVSRDVALTMEQVVGHATLDSIARQLAVALRAPEHRRALKDALRASPYVGHTLDLREFAASPAGQRVVKAAAMAAGIAPPALATTIAHLPAIDLSVPVRADRLTWTGDREVIVATPASNDYRTLPAYRSDGTGGNLAGD